MEVNFLGNYSIGWEPVQHDSAESPDSSESPDSTESPNSAESSETPASALPQSNEASQLIFCTR